MNVWAVQYFDYEDTSLLRIYATRADATRYIQNYVKESNLNVVTVNDDAYGFEIVAKAPYGSTLRLWCESYPVLCMPAK